MTQPREALHVEDLHKGFGDPPFAHRASRRIPPHPCWSTLPALALLVLLSCWGSTVDAAYDPMVEAVQEALTERGFKPGKIDGAMGSRTRNALRSSRARPGCLPPGRSTPRPSRPWDWDRRAPATHHPRGRPRRARPPGPAPHRTPTPRAPSLRRPHPRRNPPAPSLRRPHPRRNPPAPSRPGPHPRRNPPVPSRPGPHPRRSPPRSGCCPSRPSAGTHPRPAPRRWSASSQSGRPGISVQGRTPCSCRSPSSSSCCARGSGYPASTATRARAGSPSSSSSGRTVRSSSPRPQARSSAGWQSASRLRSAAPWRYDRSPGATCGTRKGRYG